MIQETSRIRIHSCLNDGLNLRRKAGQSTKQHGFPFQLAFETVLGGRISLFTNNVADSRLAMMEFKMALATFVWHFDARLKMDGQAEPYYKDNFVVRRGPLEIVITPVNRETKIESKE